MTIPHTPIRRTFASQELGPDTSRRLEFRSFSTTTMPSAQVRMGEKASVSRTGIDWRRDVGRHADTIHHMNALFSRLQEIASDPDPEARDSDPATAPAIASAAAILHRLSTCATCNTLSRSGVAATELYSMRDGGMLIILPLNGYEFEYTLGPDGETELSATKPGDLGDFNRIIEFDDVMDVDSAIHATLTTARG